jgi:hypothetical protein
MEFRRSIWGIKGEYPHQVTVRDTKRDKPDKCPRANIDNQPT